MKILKQNNFTFLLVNVACFTLILKTYYSNYNIVSAIILIILGFYVANYYKNKFSYFTSAIGSFSFMWLFTIGLACLQLNHKQVNWQVETWTCLILAYAFAVIGNFLESKFKKNINISSKEISKSCFFSFVITLFGLVIVSLITEIVLNRGNLPAFSDDMSSYANFGVGIIHYFTICCAFVPSSCYIYYKSYKISAEEKLLLIIMSVMSLLIPILIVSRQLIIVTIVISILTYIKFNLKDEKKILILLFVLIFGAWFLVGGLRNQNDGYLRYALNINDEDTKYMSVKSMQAYMYIALNYDNFNINVGQNAEYGYGYGINSVYPIFGLLRIKKLMPQELFEMPLQLKRIISVYNTYPSVQTPYMDGRILGVVIYFFIIGIIASRIDKMDKDKPFEIFLSVIIKNCLIFSFFSCWLSRPNWWFYIIILFLLCRIFFKDRKLPREEKK